MSALPSKNDHSRPHILLRPLAATLAFTSAGPLSASIIYNNTAIGGGTGPVSYDFAIDPVNDFTLSIDSTDPYKPVSLTSLSGATITGGEISLGSEVGPGSSFISGRTGVADGQHYYGFSLTDGSTLYGWLNVTRSGADATLTGTVTEWAYETSGANITVGAIPEPASTAAVAALLAGSVAVWNRRRQKLANKAA